MLGKLVGFFVGLWALKGIWGALLGAILGHIVWDSPKKRARKELYFKYVCRALAKIARIDGRVTREEIDAVEEFFRAFDIDSQTRRRAIEIFNASKMSSETLEDITESFAGEFTDYFARRAYMIILCRVAAADGGISRMELAVLSNTAKILGFDIGEFVWTDYSSGRSSGYGGEYSGGRGGASSASSYVQPSELESAYATLGVSANAGDEEIKKAYRRRCKELHPDLMRSKGLGDIAIRALEQELSRVNDAYSTIKKYRK